MDTKVDVDKKQVNEKAIAWVRAKNQKRLDDIWANVPNELKLLNNWTPFVLKKVDGKDKPLKQPAYLSGKISKNNDESTWYSFDEAMRLARENNFCAGLMFATKGSGYTCLDLDKCIDEHGNYSALAQRTLEVLPNNFAEVSVSGKGLHIFAKDNILENGKYKQSGMWSDNIRANEIEVLEQNNFVSITGDVLNCWEKSQKRQGLGLLPEKVKVGLQNVLQSNEITAKKAVVKEKNNSSANISRNKSDDAVLYTMFRSKNGKVLENLYKYGSSGDWSRDDLKFASALAYFSHSDLSQMIRIFESSAMYRPDESKKSSNYVERTCMKAVDSLVREKDR